MMTNKEAVNWIINLSADIGKSEHSELWHYEQALYEIREMLESAEPNKGKWVFKRLYKEADECICSECGQLMTTAHGKRMRFCPNCGAKMELKEE